MLEASGAPTDAPHDAAPAADSVHELRALIERMQAELRFEKTRNEALNFEVARLKRWRFGTSSESLDSTTQAVLFDAIVADTALEDQAARDEAKPPAAPRAKRQAVRQALPAGLPRVERHHEIEATHCACGEALKRIGQDGCTARRTSWPSARCTTTSARAAAARMRAGFSRASAGPW